MPELPEVETIKRYLEKELVGKEIISFQNFYKKNKIKKYIVGQKIVFFERKGKYLIIRLTHNQNLLFHLKMTGQIFVMNQPVKQKTTRAIFVFADNRGLLRGYTQIVSETFANYNKPFFEPDSYQSALISRVNPRYLIFNDARKFGWVKTLDNEELKKELNKLGPEPFSKEFTFEYLKNIFKKLKRPIKLVLMDQEKIAGIGNIYANEALFLARIHPLRPANKLKDEEIEKLRISILEVLKIGLKYEGASPRFYRKPDMSKGEYQEHFLVYDRENQECYQCGNKIKRIELNNRGTYFCPKCQIAD